MNNRNRTKLLVFDAQPAVADNSQFVCAVNFGRPQGYVAQPVRAQHS